MATGVLFNVPRTAPLDGGTVQPASKLYFYRTGTVTAQNTYSDSNLATPNANPVVADSEGVFGKIYLDAGTGFDYRVRWETSTGVLIWQEDDVKAGSAESPAYTVRGAAPYVDLIETGVTANNGGWRIRADAQELVIYLMNDAQSVLTEVLSIRNRSGTASADVRIASLQVTGAAEFDALVTFDSTVTGTTGQFTGTLTGCTTSPTTTFYWTKLGNVVTLALQAAGVTGTSNATSMNITGLPAAIQPANAKLVPCVAITDNGVQHLDGYVSISGSVLTFFLEGGASFTSSGTKGLQAYWSIVYGLD